MIGSDEVRALLRATKWTQSELGSRVGVQQATVSRWLKGSVPDHPQQSALERLMVEHGLEAGEDEPGFGVVPVIGEIAAGGRIEVNSDDFSRAEPLYEIKVPFQVPPDSVALRVNGDSMWPRYDPGDVIICYRYSQDPAPLVGFEAAVGTPDGNRYLKRLLEGSETGLFNLESHNAGTMRDVQVAWVSEVFGVVRAARWEKLSDAERRRAMRRAVA